MEKLSASYYDFAPSRQGTGCYKYDAPLPAAARADTIPMWVADMDIRTAPAVIDALQAACAHGIFGYAGPDAAYDDLVCKWYERRMHWHIQPQWICKTPGIVFAVSMAICAVTDKAESVLIQQPVYHPFAHVIQNNGRQLVVTELVNKNGKYEVDFADFEAKIIKNKVKAFLLCSPHNPIAKVWTRQELEEMSRICIKHGVIIISDEIHSDFIYAGNVHIPMATLSEEVAARTITCTAPSKTFNIAGLQASNIIISEPKLRQAYQAVFEATGCGGLNCLSLVATKTAYREAEPWLEGLLDYLSENIRILREGLQHTPIRMTPAQGTYLMWLDCRALGMTADGLNEFFLQKAGLWCNRGDMFGAGGEGFMRMNIGCTHETVHKAVERLQHAMEERE